MELWVQGQWAISVLTKDWSAKRKTALLAGEEATTDELKAAATAQTLREPESVDAHVEVRLDGNGAGPETSEGATE